MPEFLSVEIIYLNVQIECVFIAQVEMVIESLKKPCMSSHNIAVAEGQHRLWVWNQPNQQTYTNTASQ